MVSPLTPMQLATVFTSQSGKAFDAHRYRQIYQMMQMSSSRMGFMWLFLSSRIWISDSLPNDLSALPSYCSPAGKSHGKRWFGESLGMQRRKAICCSGAMLAALAARPMQQRPRLETMFPQDCRFHGATPPPGSLFVFLFVHSLLLLTKRSVCRLSHNSIASSRRLTIISSLSTGKWQGRDLILIIF